MENVVLSINEVKNLLPDEMKINDSIARIYRVVYTTSNGELLPIVSSKISNKYIMYNFCTDFYIKLGCKHICLIVGNKGIILIPIQIIKRYNKFSGWKIETKKGRQYWVRGKYIDGIVTLTNSNDVNENIDTTPYFIHI